MVADPLTNDNSSALSLDSLKSLEFGPKWARGLPKENRVSTEDFSAPTFKNKKSKISRDKRSESPAASFKDYFEVDFYPEEQAFSALCKAMRQTAKTYALFEVAKLIVEKPERFVLSIKKIREEKTSDGLKRTVLPLWVCLLDQLAFQSEEELLSHVLKEHVDAFFTIQTIEKEAPKGSFPCVHRCGITQEWIAPPNYHRYQEILRNHYNERLSLVSFEDFLKKIEADKTPEALEAWTNKMKTVTLYTPKNQPEATSVPLEGACNAKKYLLKHCFFKFLKKVNTLRLSGKLLAKMPISSLRTAIQQELDFQRTFPLQTANNLRSSLRRLGFYLYKTPLSSVTYVSAVQPKTKEAGTQFSESIQKLIVFLEENPLVPVHQFSEKFLSLKADEDQNICATQLMRDLRWLIEEGYVIEYADGRLEIAFSKNNKLAKTDVSGQFEGKEGKENAPSNCSLS